MSTITKGTLVMTEQDLAFYIERSECADTGENMSQHVVKNLLGEVCYVLQASLATRAQVETKVKKMGWMPTYRNYGFSHNKNIYFLMSFNNTDFIVKLEDSISSQDFDTASSQLAEAILVARMLNATKE
jgi:hypothetical protein